MCTRSQEEITRLGDPSKPKGEEGALMLRRMNESHAPLTQWAFSLLQFCDNEIVLDIGCGGGAALKRASVTVSEGKLFGVDYSSVSVALATENNSEDIKSGHIKIIEVSVADLPFENDMFDCIYTIESFYFWKDPESDLKEVYRVLKSGGRFAIIAEIYQKSDISKEALDNIKRYDMNNPDPEEFLRLLRFAGFSDVNIHTKPGTDWICVIGCK